MGLSWATNKAAFQHYQAIKNRNGDIYLVKDKEETEGTTEESTQTTETTTEEGGDKGADSSGEDHNNEPITT